MFVNKKKVAVLIVLVIMLFTLFYINLPKNCEKDYENCFSDNVSKCSKSKVLASKDDNLYRYEVVARKQDSCIVKVSLAKVSETQSLDLKKALEGKSMLCSLPMSLINTKDINSIENLNDYCTGQLKEAILEITLQKLYDVVVQNIGPVASEIRGISGNITK